MRILTRTYSFKWFLMNFSIYVIISTHFAFDDIHFGKNLHWIERDYNIHEYVLLCNRKQRICCYASFRLAYSMYLKIYENRVWSSLNDKIVIIEFLVNDSSNQINQSNSMTTLIRIIYFLGRGSLSYRDTMCISFLWDIFT